ncbi:nucleoporin p54 isoform X2 [Tetranychus urticae]|uniref:Nucleoporin Nup54 alpha-helical domain-containing protein n=1 Tax=Tetranychus urticae TaxID=32264 RepID=T1KQP0_TETUR|nr:nucleoporin p54 isoform X1 [Tetranychus urticae]XP_015789472.1 nucleoporin p54 isoform X2 [Tetranychus urticae]
MDLNQPSVFNPKMFNDERDQVLGLFNKLQAYWGTGKAFYMQGQAPIDLNQHQPNHRFKAIGYSKIKSEEASESKFGVVISMEGGESQMNTAILQYENNLKGLFGQNYVPKVEASKILPDNKAMLMITVTDTATNLKLPARQIILFLNQMNVKMQLPNVFQNKFCQLVPLHPPSKQEIDEYLKVVPAGIDELIWNQAKLNNPDPEKFIPVPLIGFAALNERFKLQEQEVQQQRLQLKLIMDEIENITKSIAVIKILVEECKRKNVLLSNRVLSLMVWQMVKRRRFYPVQAYEDQLRAKLEDLQREINEQGKLKSNLNDLMIKLKQLQNHQTAPSFTIDENLLKDVKSHLTQEQDAIQHLLSLVKNLPKKTQT